ncbi:MULTISPECIES: YbaN family protein [unclassified Variovorax]|uniref:YbaN family protein n=1 Tax=unclassified Variovorax TaxID=663243 RepID=UPI003ED03802
MKWLEGAIARLLWRVLALVLVALGLLGVFLPVLPTVPFLLAAAWAGGRGWPALEHWLLDHPRYGESIRRWRQEGAVSRRAKWAASWMMFFSTAVLLVTNAPIVVKVAAPLLMAVIAIWLWKRPEP